MKFEKLEDFKPKPEESILKASLEQYKQAKLIYSCYKSGVFEFMSYEPRTANKISELSGYIEARLEVTLNAIVGMGLAMKKSDEYSLTEEAAKLLCRDSSYFMGDLIEMDFAGSEANGEALKKWLQGTAEQSGHNPEIIFTHSFLRAMAQGVLLDNSIYETANLIGAKPCFKNAHTLLDVGGGHGLFAAALKMLNPHIDTAVFDLPQNCSVTEKYAQACGEIIGFYPGDFYKEDLPGGRDIVLCCDVLYPVSAETRTAVMKKIFACLNDGGHFFLKLWYLNEDRTKPREISSLALRCRMQTDKSYVFTLEEAQGMLKAVGFRIVEVMMAEENSWKIIHAGNGNI